MSFMDPNYTYELKGFIIQLWSFNLKQRLKLTLNINSRKNTTFSSQKSGMTFMDQK